MAYLILAPCSEGVKKTFQLIFISFFFFFVKTEHHCGFIFKRVLMGIYDIKNKKKTVKHIDSIDAIP